MNVSLPVTQVTVRTILNVVCASYSLSEIEILSSRRTTRISEARHMAMWLAMTLTPRSSGEIARLIGKDHKSVLYGLRKVTCRMEAEPDFHEHAMTLRCAVLTAQQCLTTMGINGTPEPSLEETAERILSRGPTAASSIEILRLASAYLADRRGAGEADEPDTQETDDGH